MNKHIYKVKGLLRFVFMQGYKITKKNSIVYRKIYLILISNLNFT